MTGWRGRNLKRLNKLLSNHARESDNFNSFVQYVSANQELMREFEKLAELESLGSREEVWKVL